MADEVPTEGIAVDAVLRLQVLGTVLADDLDTRLGEGGHVLDGDVLRRGHDGDGRAYLLADLPVALANLSR
jgi:hypothetical protein